MSDSGKGEEVRRDTVRDERYGIECTFRHDCIRRIQSVEGLIVEREKRRQLAKQNIEWTVNTIVECIDAVSMYSMNTY